MINRTPRHYSWMIMKRSSTTTGLVVALIAALTFGTSGAIIKPLFDAGWSPAAAVAARVLTGGIVLLPIALFVLRGKWSSVWANGWRILAMAGIGVAGTQLVYFAAIQRIPVGTGILIEYMAPLLLVAVAWVVTRKMPKVVVLIGSVVALAGLVLVVAPSGGASLDVLGVIFALGAMVGCACYYVIAARPSNGLPTVALACFGLVLGGLMLLAAGGIGIVPFTTSTMDVAMFGTDVPWWVPLIIVGVISTAIAYYTSIAASEMLGSRLASFVGLLEVVAATFYAWILLGEQLGLPQLIGGVLILAGIGFVRSEKKDEAVAVFVEVSPASVAHDPLGVDEPRPVGVDEPRPLVADEFDSRR